MTVYVDDMFKTRMGRFRRMNMSHMIADTEEELHEMAQKIGLERRWYQGDHYDVALGRRKIAVRLGAVEITMRELGRMLIYRRKHGKLPTLEEVRYGKPKDAGRQLVDGGSTFGRRDPQQAA